MINHSFDTLSLIFASTNEPSSPIVHFVTNKKLPSMPMPSDDGTHFPLRSKQSFNIRLSTARRRPSLPGLSIISTSLEDGNFL
mmetsp:Transcript_28669/g.42773  ORF Transcript_28669/g.42773 Transcript_28669/m.42773 type:complete len:83 (+) Transcript_28669:296-544(+)